METRLTTFVNMVDDREDAADDAGRGRPGHVLAALSMLDRRVERDLRRLLPRDVHPIRGSYGRILDLIADAGSRPSALAAGDWITKQAIGKRLRELEELGWVSLVPDPSDGRALIVRRTRKGDRVRAAARSAIHAMEEEWSAAVGADRYATFRAVLDELRTGGPGEAGRAP